MIPTFVIFLREGIEASMIVAILLAYLDKIGQRRYFRDVFAGVAAAILLLVAGGVAAYLLIKQYSGSTAQTVFETVTYLLAATVLTYMTFWMQSHSRTMSADLQRRSEEAINGKARLGLGLLAFQAVGREGVETMVFTLAIVFASSTQAATNAHGNGLLLGAMLGLAVSLAIAYAIFKLGRRLNLGLFFRILGVVLMVFAAGLLADAVQNMQELGWLPFLEGHVWNTSSFLSEHSTAGDLFHSLLGYADRPTALQVIVWATYLSVATTLFITRGRRARRGATSVVPTDADMPAGPEFGVVAGVLPSDGTSDAPPEMADDVPDPGGAARVGSNQ
jgi:high-affinity iron transporter